MTAQHQIHITTTDGEQITSTSEEGSSEDIGPILRKLLDEHDAQTTFGFKTADGWVVIRARNIERIRVTDVDPDEASALADCGDQA